MPASPSSRRYTAMRLSIVWIIPILAALVAIVRERHVGAKGEAAGVQVGEISKVELKDKEITLFGDAQFQLTQVEDETGGRDPRVTVVRPVDCNAAGASAGTTIGLPRLTTPPACQIQVSRMMPLSARKSVSALPTGSFFQRRPWS